MVWKYRRDLIAKMCAEESLKKNRYGGVTEVSTSRKLLERLEKYRGIQKEMEDWLTEWKGGARIDDADRS